MQRLRGFQACERCALALECATLAKALVWNSMLQCTPKVGSAVNRISTFAEYVHCRAISPPAYSIHVLNMH